MRHWNAVILAGLTTLALASGIQAAGKCAHSSECGCEHATCYTCRAVPDVKPIKKTIYECKLVPFCVHRPSHAGHCDRCEQCDQCEACPRFMKVLVKREIVVGHTCGTKCVAEEALPCGPACWNGGHEAAPAPAKEYEETPAEPQPPEKAARRSR
jgi:hypothetical protein